MDESEETPARDEKLGYERRACLIATIVALASGAMLIARTEGFALDDAWIHLSYAKSLRLGEGLSYNPFDWELGFSSPLWVLSLTLWPWVGDPTLGVKLLGVLFHAATAWLTAALIIDIGRHRATVGHPVPLQSLAALGGSLVALHPALVHGATSGMEVPLAAMLAVALSLSTTGGHVGASAAVGALATLARPELAAYAAALAGSTLLFRRRSPLRDAPCKAAAAGACGSLGAFAAWMLYNVAVSGQVWPNAQLVKGRGGGVQGLSYVLEEVLPWQPWLVALTGAVLLARVLWTDARARRWDLLALVSAGAATVVVIALTRPLHLGVGFFESRYFAIVAPLPLVALPFALVGLRRVLVALALLPIALVTGLQLTEVRETVRAQEEDTLVLHVQVARYLADRLPDDAVVGVEGAGATRFWTPRDMTIVDLVGLNDHVAARNHFDRAAKTCHFVARNLTHVAIPEHWLPQFQTFLDLKPIARFEDPVYTQVQPPRALAVVVAAVEGPRPSWRERCKQRLDG